MKLTALAAVAVLALAGCSSSTPATGTAAPTSTKASTTPTQPVASTPVVTTAPADGPIALGRWFMGTDVKTRVIQVRKSVSSPNSDLTESQRWYAALVQTCVTSIPANSVGAKTLSFSWGPWSVSDASGAQYEASSSTWEDFPRPAYPFSGDVGFAQGECAKGWIMFSVLKDTKVVLVRYSNDSGDLGRWKL